MSSEISIKLPSMRKPKWANRWSLRQAGSASIQGDAPQSQPSTAPRTLPPTTSNSLTGGGEGQSDDMIEHPLSSGNPSAPSQPRSVNIVLFGETGVGKSSVINLIARKEVAKVSSDVNGCTMQSTRYDISFDDMNFSIFDTIGLEEPQMGVNGYLKAIERAYELIIKLGAAGGIHLLLFCMRGGRITATTQSNYRLFCECLCSKKVPIALVFTGLEREDIMENWWDRNKRHIEYYGISSSGHACITAVQDETPEDHKYEESQTKIRTLLKECALKNEAFSLERHTWFVWLGRGMRSFIEKRKSPKRKDVMRVLTRRCKLDPETARKIADMMEKGDTDKEDDTGGIGGPPTAPKGEGESTRKDQPEAKSCGTDVPDVKDEDRGTNEAARNCPTGPSDDKRSYPAAPKDRNERTKEQLEAEPRGTDAPDVKDGYLAANEAARNSALALSDDKEPYPLAPKDEDQSTKKNQTEAGPCGTDTNDFPVALALDRLQENSRITLPQAIPSGHLAAKTPTRANSVSSDQSSLESALATAVSAISDSFSLISNPHIPTSNSTSEPSADPFPSVVLPSESEGVASESLISGSNTEPLSGDSGEDGARASYHCQPKVSRSREEVGVVPSLPPMPKSVPQEKTKINDGGKGNADSRKMHPVRDGSEKHPALANSRSEAGPYDGVLQGKDRGQPRTNGEQPLDTSRPLGQVASRGAQFRIRPTPKSSTNSSRNAVYIDS